MRPRASGVALILVSVGIAVATGLIGLPPVAWALVELGALAALLPFAVGLIRRRFDVFEPLFLFAFSYAALFVVRPAFDLLAFQGPIAVLGYSVRETYSFALVVGLLGMLSFCAGYYLPTGAELAKSLPTPGNKWSSGTLSALILLALGLSMAMYAVFIATSGGLPTLVAILSGRNPISHYALAEASGYLYAAPLWLTGLGVLVLARAKTWRSLTGAAGIALVGYSQFSHLTLGDRAYVLPALASVGLLWYLRRGRRPSPLTITAALLTVFLIAVVAPRQYRETVGRTQTFAEIVTTNITHPYEAIQEFFQNADTRMVSDLAVELQSVPSNLSFQYGATYLEAAGRPIPHAIWPSKPVSADTQLMRVIWPEWDARGVGFSFSLFGEPYLNLGVPGVIVFCFLFGVLWNAIYCWYRRHPQNPTAMTLFALSWPFVFVYMRGGLGADYHRQLIFVLPVLVALFLAEIRKPGQEQLAGSNAHSWSEPALS